MQLRTVADAHRRAERGVRQRAVSGARSGARARTRVGSLTPGDLLRLPQAITIRERPVEADPAVEAQLGASVEAAVEQALADLDAMRMREGEHLRADLDARRQMLAGLVEQLAAAADEGRTRLEARLHDRVREISFELPVDQAMIAQEIVRAAARSDISEEVTRFRAHLAHWEALQAADEPCGRKLDFLLQEMNREINTIGVQGRRAPRVGADHHRQGGAREDARAGPECRVAADGLRRTRRGLLFIVSAPSGNGQDDAGRAAGAGRAESDDVAVVHVPAGPAGGTATASTIISSAGNASRRWSAKGRFSSGPTCSATITAPQRPIPRRCSLTDGTSCS